ncbi:MAG: AAA-like domain-containing protein [Cyanobacteria bacterium P01_C01_bin.72]
MSADIDPFYAGSTISDQRYFVGYQNQLDTITMRAVSVQPTSINVIGRNRIGKSSLLYNFCQTYEERIAGKGKDTHNFLAVYISLQQGNCQSKAGFYRVIAEELVKILQPRFNWFRQPKKLLQDLKATSFDTDSFYEAMVQFRDVEILPIICLDDIESLFQQPEEFDNGFYDNLRSLMDKSALMLIIASDSNLRVYSEQKKLTSSFFNVGQVIKLEGYSQFEAGDLVRLPQTIISDQAAALSEAEQKIALSWGGKNPYLLQSAGLYLWEAKKSNENTAWAREKFKRQAQGISSHYGIWGKCGRFIYWLFWRIPVKLGRFIYLFGSNLGEVANGILGLTMIGLIILVCLRKVPVEEAIKFFLD